jgi:hypothetical protein
MGFILRVWRRRRAKAADRRMFMVQENRSTQILDDPQRIAEKFAQREGGGLK